MPNIKLARYDWVVVNSSGGKDSQASLAVVVAEAKKQQYPLSRIVVAHADLGEVEWPGTRELVAEHSAHYGLRCEVEKRPQGDLLQHIEERGMWPSSKQRYCTSDHKRGQIARLFTRLTKETHDQVTVLSDVQPVGGDRAHDARRSHGARLPVDRLHHRTSGRRCRDKRRDHRACCTRQKVRFLNVFGFRAEESPARRKKKPFEKDARLTNTRRHVDIWLPIHRWKTADVWAEIRRAGTRHHWAYDRGMKRLSCRFCIFAPESQLVVAARQPENKELFKKYVQLQIRIGHKFRMNTDLVELQKKVDDPAFQLAVVDDGCWNM